MISKLQIFNKTMLGVCCCTLLFLTGCGVVQNLTVQTLGNKILETVGILPKSSMFDARDSLLKALETMSREEEYYLGRAVSAKILSNYELSQDKHLVEYLHKVGLVVAGYSSLPETFGGYHFGILESDQINAVSAPGGFVFISKGLLNLLDDEDMLAAVIAHEVSHIANRHGIKAIQSSSLRDVLGTAGQVIGSLNCAELLTQATLVFGGAVNDVVSTLLDRGYSREQEGEADNDAVENLMRAGYDPSALIEVLSLVEAAKKDGEKGWFSTHPGMTERIKLLQDQLAVVELNQFQQYRELRGERFLRQSVN